MPSTYARNISTKWRFVDMTFQPDKPFEIPPLPPESDIESKAILKQCISSRSALAELNAVARLIPNQAMLINTLPMLEAKASSEIENIVTTEDELFRYSQLTRDGHFSSSTKEAYRYQQALSKGSNELKKKPLCTNLAIEICSTIKGQRMEVRRVPGTTLANPTSGKTIYTPPVGEENIIQKLQNWEQFIHDSTQFDPLIRLAVAHYQFEAIHPFADGNGRTGRVLNILFLIGENLIEMPILYLSRFIIENKSDYYRLLLSVTIDGNWEEWILYMLRAVEETSIWTKNKIESIKLLFDNSATFLRKKEPKIYSRELVEVLFRQPYCRISNVVESGIAKRETASIYLKRLCDIGFLNELRVGKDKLFVNPSLLKIVTQESNEIVDFQ